MSLSKKSNDDILKLLDEHGIKHGPVVDSTRKQYEKKLEKVVEKSSVKASSDKTYYREEEETSYVTYRSPFGEEGFVDTVIRRGISTRDEDKELDQHTNASKSTIQFTSKTVNHSVQQSSLQYNKPPIKSGSSKWKAVRLLLLLLAVFAAACYGAYWYLWNYQS
ncbi:emerin (Emery-Dreifuss muscular dystrophy) [Betta splendens]|uniref:Emerin (Emery-Dreifuss muscular dystrophy) n=1 Tax=Betta splendens TaxID=158456 RepID=A0A6P7N4U5_BETSP|nr:emerin (Emery-Dreifuss muscular dystrophy) [Betta splendens]